MFIRSVSSCPDLASYENVGHEFFSTFSDLASLKLQTFPYVVLFILLWLHGPFSSLRVKTCWSSSSRQAAKWFVRNQTGLIFRDAHT
jgi:hypothetical protein